MFNSLLKNINKFQTENETLREQNKELIFELKSLQILLKSAQKDVERSKEKYKLLKSINKSLSDALENSITYFKLDETDTSEKTQKHMSLVEERLLIDSKQRNNGLINLITTTYI